MALRCLECSGDLHSRAMITRLGDVDVWYCDYCNIYYDKKELKSLLSSR